MLSVKQSEAYFTETVKITVNGKWIAYVVRPERLPLQIGSLYNGRKYYASNLEWLCYFNCCSHYAWCDCCYSCELFQERLVSPYAPTT